VDINLNEVTVAHNEEAHRFEASIGGLRAFVAYRRFPGCIVFVHTEVPPPFEGHGLAGKLAGAALDFARVNHLQVVPLCPYISRFIEKHTEYRDLVSSDDLQKLFTR
jgi:predicted GNAT family acetyltransferase